MTKFMEKLQKQKSILVLVCVLMISFGAMLYFGNQKQGYHVDEIYSYGLSNSEYLPFMHFGEHDYDVKDWMNEYGAGESLGDLFSNLWKDFLILKECDFNFYNSEIYEAYRVAQANSQDTYTTTWVSGQNYQDYLAVSDSNTFNYASVYYNQRGDVHPPFFYILLHTICSVFQGVFSKWFGLGLNIVILLLALVVIYRMCDKHFGGKMPAITAVCMYAFSVGFMSTAMFIRMYALLTLMTLLCTYVHLNLFKEDFKFNKRILAALFFSVLGGYYTQYYFVLYAIGMATVTMIVMLLKRKWKGMINYVLTIGSAAVTGILIWPFSVKHVFGGYRGQASLGVLQSGNFYWYKAEWMLYYIVSNVFGGYIWIPIALAIASITICFISIWHKKRFPFAKTAILSVPIVFYALIVGQISPFLTDRYVMCTYPFWCIMCTAAVYYVMRNLIHKSDSNMEKIFAKSRNTIILIVFIVLIGVSNYVVNEPGYIFKDGQENYKVPDNTDCVFIIPNGSYNESSEEISIMAQCRRVGIVFEDNLDVLAEDYRYQSGDYLLVEITNSLDENTVLKKVREKLGVEVLKELGREPGSGCIRILLGQ